MRHPECEVESSILEALNSEGIKEPAREHLRDCASCRDMVQSHEWMHAYARVPVAQTPLPDPGLIWITHEMMRTTQRLTGFSLNVGRLETFGISLLAAAWALLFAWKWDAVSALLQSQAASDAMMTLVNAQVLSLPFILAVLTLVCASVLMSVRGVLIDGL